MPIAVTRYIASVRGTVVRDLTKAARGIKKKKKKEIEEKRTACGDGENGIGSPPSPPLIIKLHRILTGKNIRYRDYKCKLHGEDMISLFAFTS